MKLITSILFICCLHVSVKTSSQVINLSVKKLKLESILEMVKKQTGFTSFYDEKALKDANPVSITAINTSLIDFLNQIFKDQPLSYIIEGKAILISRKTTSEKKQITNLASSKISDLASDILPFIRLKVLDSLGRPLSGATVALKNNVLGVTDAEGVFNVNVTEGDVLTVTFVGYESRTIVVTNSMFSSANSLIITLKAKVNELDDVEVTVNTGYQNISKERATGSFVKVDNKMLNQQVGTNILKRLEGVTSGLLFDNNKIRGGNSIVTNDNISIRGVSTINSSMDPLIILDGFIYEGKISNINPNDIDNITVLKDAAATSIWGAKAGNGVIVITTKKGKLNQRTQVSLNSTVLIGEKPDLFSLPQMSSKDYVDVEQFLYSKGFFNSQISLEYLPVTPAVEIFEKKRLGLITEQDSIKLINELIQNDSRDEFLKYLYGIPITQQYNVNLRGGGLNSAYTFSVSYDDVMSQLRDKDQKLNVLLNNIFQPLKWLKAEVELYYTKNDFKSGAPSYGSIMPAGRVAPYFRLVDNDGSALPIAINFNPNFTDTLASGKLKDWKFYPYNDYKHNISRTRTQDFFVNAGLQTEIASWLHLNAKGQYQKQSIESSTLSDMSSYFTRNMINSFTQFDPVSGVTKYIVPLGSIKTVGNNELESYTARLQVDIAKMWKRHSFNGILGYEVRDTRVRKKQYTSYGYNSDPLITIPVDYVNSYPHIIFDAEQTIPGSPTESESVNRFVSIYGNVSYNFDRRYTISGSIRRDGSNLFGVHTNDKWKPLWSIGGMWNISSEKFYSSLLLTNLNFRATYGFSGNVDLNMTAVPIGTYSVSLLSNLPTARVQILNNPTLNWEKSGMFNIGLDFSFRNSIISGSVEYYRKKGTDLYGLTLYDYTTWGYINEITVNSASLRGEGIDIEIIGKIVDKGLKWTSGILFNYNTNRVTKYNSSNPLIYSKLNSSTLNLPIVGKPLYSIAAFKWGGLDSTGNPQGYVDGKLTTDYSKINSEAIEEGLNGNLSYIGPTTPTFFGSFNNTFSWKRLSLNFLISYKLAYYFQKPSIAYSRLISSGVGHSEFEKRWKKRGDENITSVPAFLPEIYQNSSDRDFFYNSSEINVLKGDNIRLQYINLLYTFPSLLNGKVKDFQLFINAANLGILWRANDAGIDPDFPNTFSPSRTYALGFRANF